MFNFFNNYSLMLPSTIVLFSVIIIIIVTFLAAIIRLIAQWGYDAYNMTFFAVLSVALLTAFGGLFIPIHSYATHTSTQTYTGTIKNIKEIQNSNSDNQIRLTVQTKNGIINIDEPVMQDDSASQAAKELNLNDTISFKLEGFRSKDRISNIRIKSLITEQKMHYKKNQKHISVQNLFLR